jgi:hypothetical protein
MHVTELGKQRLQSPEVREYLHWIVDQHKYVLESTPGACVAHMAAFATFILAGFDGIDLSIPEEEELQFYEQNKAIIDEPCQSVLLERIAEHSAVVN